MRHERAAPPVRAAPRMRRFEPPCLRLCRSPSPSMPFGASSGAGTNGAAAGSSSDRWRSMPHCPRAGAVPLWSCDAGWSRPAADGLSRRHWRHWRRGPVLLWRRDEVLKSGVGLSSPDSASRVAIRPFASGLGLMAPRWFTLAERQSEKDLEGQAGLGRGVAACLPTASASGRYRFPLKRSPFSGQVRGGAKFACWSCRRFRAGALLRPDGCLSPERRVGRAADRKRASVIRKWLLGSAARRLSPARWRWAGAFA